VRVCERTHREGIGKMDFLPRDNVVAEIQPTRACLMLRDLLVPQIEYMKKYLPAKDVKCVVVDLPVCACVWSLMCDS
jgi:hypothetical protein